jgi:hypothetical protein
MGSARFELGAMTKVFLGSTYPCSFATYGPYVVPRPYDTLVQQRQDVKDAVKHLYQTQYKDTSLIPVREGDDTPLSDLVGTKRPMDAWQQTMKPLGVFSFYAGKVFLLLRF